MICVREYDDELYKARYVTHDTNNCKKIWNNIKKNDELLKESIKVEKDKFGERDLVKGLAICEAMLIDYKGVNQEIYQELVNLIYSNTEIARTVLDGASNGGYSYLLMTLWNYELELTDEQKEFAVNEAMNKIGTTKREKEKEALSKRIDEAGITNDQITIVDLDGCLPIGVKYANMCLYSMIASLSSSQAHGILPFDIRYEILRNPNWSIQEKQKLVYDFWGNDEEYEECLEEWEWSIINDEANYKGQSLPQLDKSELYDYTYNDLLKFYGNRETTDRIWNDIIFCQSMHELRPMQGEADFQIQKVLK